MNTELETLTTIKDYLRWTYSQLNASAVFYGHGTDNAWDEALTLVLRALNIDFDIPPHMLDAKLTQPECDSLQSIIKKRIDDRVPTAYLTQYCFFADHDFYIDERVLIPRSPIAELIEKQFAPWIGPDGVKRILDIGTGSACLPIIAASHFPDVEIVAADIDADALEVAKINVDNYGLENQISLVKSDVFENIQGKFDVIISNPPYVAQTEYETLAAEYSHEPKLALVADDDGLAIVKRIVAQAKNHLTEHGILIIEVGNSQKQAEQAFKDLPLTWLEFERGGSGVFLLQAQHLN